MLVPQLKAAGLLPDRLAPGAAEGRFFRVPEEFQGYRRRAGPVGYRKYARKPASILGTFWGPNPSWTHRKVFSKLEHPTRAARKPPAPAPRFPAQPNPDALLQPGRHLRGGLGLRLGLLQPLHDALCGFDRDPSLRPRLGRSVEKASAADRPPSAVVLPGNPLGSGGLVK